MHMDAAVEVEKQHGEVKVSIHDNEGTRVLILPEAVYNSLIYRKGEIIKQVLIVK